MLARIRSAFTRSSPGGGEADASKALARDHIRRERWTDAAGCYRRCLALDPDDIDAHIGLGFVLNEQAQFRDATHHLDCALALDEHNVDAHFLRGLLAKSTGNPTEAIDHFRRTVELASDFAPGLRELIGGLLSENRVHEAVSVAKRAVASDDASAELHGYLGSALAAAGEADGALEHYRRAVALAPDIAQWQLNLADALLKSENFVEAANGYRRVLALSPDNALAHASLGYAEEKQGRLDAAADGYKRAVAIDPKLIAGHQYLGNLLMARGATQAAIACFARILEIDPDHPVGHLINTLSGRDSEHAPAKYVAELFDQYADRFDSHLVGKLGYQAPDLLVAAIREITGAMAPEGRALDLGCGTGLSGVALAPLATEIVGVDLSAKMLEKARARNLYSRLEQQELVAMMQEEQAAAYRFVFAADVFVYIGDLNPVAAQARRLLESRGYFAFSVESLDALRESGAARPDAPDYQLHAKGRYAHSLSYLSGVALAHGFEVVRVATAQSRLEQGKPVIVHLCVWRVKA